MPRHQLRWSPSPKGDEQKKGGVVAHAALLCLQLAKRLRS